MAASVRHQPAMTTLPLREGTLLRWRFLPLWLLIALFLAVGISSAAVTTTAQVTLLRDGEYQEILLKGIKSAKASIIFSFYLFKTADNRNNIPRKIADELIEARRRGVDVTVYLEKKKGRKDLLNNDNGQTAQRLHRGGVKVFFDSEHTTTHTKTVVIDSRMVFIGSHNLTQGALSRNNELSVVIDSPEMALEVKRYLNGL